MRLLNNTCFAHVFNVWQKALMFVFWTDLKLKARACNFGVLHDSVIGNHVAFRIKNEKVREQLLREIEITLADVLKICHASQLALQQAKHLVKQQEKTVQQWPLCLPGYRKLECYMLKVQRTGVFQL